MCNNGSNSSLRRLGSFATTRISPQHVYPKPQIVINIRVEKSTLNPKTLNPNVYLFLNNRKEIFYRFFKPQIVIFDPTTHKLELNIEGSNHGAIMILGILAY